MKAAVNRESPQVSIVMPVFNAAEWLSETLASIAAQTLEHYELIAVDDSSTDESSVILKSAAASDTRIRVLMPEGKGIVAALHAGIAAARAPFIARMDADDLMPADRLALQSDYLRQHEEVALVTGNVIYLGDRLQNAGYARYVDWLNTFQTPEDFTLRRFIESPVAHPSVMLRREVMVANEYRHGDFPEDYDLWLRLLGQGRRFASLPNTVLEWRDHGARASRTDSRYDIEKFYAHKAGFLAAWLRDRGHNQVSVWSGGRRSRRRIDALRDQRIEISKFIDVHPRRIGQKIQGAPVVAPETLFAGQREFVVVYVSARGARDLICGSLAAQGYLEGENFICAS